MHRSLKCLPNRISSTEKRCKLRETLAYYYSIDETASGAAVKVGYETTSQFSREFKRLFGDGPARVAADMRKLLIQES